MEQAHGVIVDADGDGVPDLIQQEQKSGTGGGLHALLAPCYSVDGGLAAFRFCDPMSSGKQPQHPPHSSSSSSNNSSKRGGNSAGAASYDKGKRSLRACYGLSVVFLAVYVAAAAAGCPNKVPLALLNVLALLVADGVHFAVTSGSGVSSFTPTRAALTPALLIYFMNHP